MAICPRRKCLWKMLLLLFLLVNRTVASYGQHSIDSILNKVDPQKWAASIVKKAGKLQQKIVDKSIKSLNKMQWQEEKALHKMLRGKDSVQAKSELASIEDKYQSFRDKLNNPLAGKGGGYIAKLDTLSTALKFLNNPGAAGKIGDALAKTNELKDRFGQADAIQSFLRQRRELLKQRLGSLGLMKQFKKINKEVYYYSEQIKEYKATLKDSKKMEQKALQLLSKTKLFQDFMRRNSQLASLFRLPGSSDPSTMASLAGLQTRAQVNNLIQRQIAAGGASAAQQVSQNMQQAQAQMNQLKYKLLKAGKGSSDDDMPDFKPNSQKTKSFLKRLEFGSNFQTQKATNLFPVTTDIGLSVGYKLNDKSIIGIGSSFKMGWGRGWRDVTITAQGMGLRSFIDYKLKGNFWISGGYEMNYLKEIRGIAELKEYSAWQRSGLIGMSKVLSIKSKFFKKTKVQLLWDFLSYRQVPRAQVLVFRIGYNF